MNNTKHALLVTINAEFVKGKKHYICPAPNTQIKLLKHFHGIDIQRRWFFYCMANLRELKYIRVRHRYTYGEQGGIQQIPSMIALTTKGLAYLNRKMTSGARALYQRMMEWLKRDDSRFPGAPDLEPTAQPQDKEKVLAMLKTIIHDIP